MMHRKIPSHVMEQVLHLLGATRVPFTLVFLDNGELHTVHGLGPVVSDGPVSRMDLKPKPCPRCQHQSHSTGNGWYICQECSHQWVLEEES